VTGVQTCALPIYFLPGKNRFGAVKAGVSHQVAQREGEGLYGC
jgi:hypothetical protein